MVLLVANDRCRAADRDAPGGAPVVLNDAVQVLRAATPVGLRLLGGGCRTVATAALFEVGWRAERVHELQILMMVVPATSRHCLRSSGLLGLVRWRLLDSERVRVRVEVVVHVVIAVVHVIRCDSTSTATA